LQTDSTSKLVPGRSRSSNSQDPKAHDQILRSWNSHHNLNRSGAEQEHPESGDIGLQINRGRQLTRGRYYASPTSETSRGSASSDEVPVEGGVALTEEAVETHIPDIITQV
jgi:hypothetical protein